MNDHWIFKLVVYAMMLGIVFALGSGLFFLLFKRKNTEQTVKALTIRIGLSLVLFGLLVLAFFLGWIEPHSLFPGVPFR